MKGFWVLGFRFWFGVLAIRELLLMRTVKWYRVIGI